MHVRGRTDVALTLIGDGDAGPALRALATELNLDEHVEFTGRAPDELVAAADVQRRRSGCPRTRRTRSTTCPR